MRVYHCFMGYILVDTAQLCIHGRNLPGWILIAIHHSICLHNYTSMLLFDFCHLLGLVCILTEITAPFMQGSILMKKSSLHTQMPTCVFVLFSNFFFFLKLYDWILNKYYAILIRLISCYFV